MQGNRIMNLLDCVIPRPIAWICVEQQQGKESLVGLLDGYNVGGDDPPTLICSSSAMPSQIFESLQATQKCSLSIVTVRDQAALERWQQHANISTSSSSTDACLSFSDWGLTATKPPHDEFPPVVDSSPIRMGCRLFHSVELASGSEQNTLLLLQVENLFLDGNVLSSPTDDMLKGGRVVRAKIEAQWIQPLASLGNNANFGTLDRFFSMHRPSRKSSQHQPWESPSPLFLPKPSKLTEMPFEDIEHDVRRDGPRCVKLGYNPFKAIVIPRPIGWISTFRKQGRVPHLAPYSFFCSIGSERCPMVAFSAYSPSGSKKRKDARADAEDMKCFVYNLVSEDLIVPMNLSAAEIASEESEFELAQLVPGVASVVDAPVVQEAHVRLECEYVRTLENIGGYSIVVAKVVHTYVDERYILSDGRLDVAKLKPVSRLGYADEYGVVDDYCSIPTIEH